MPEITEPYEGSHVEQALLRWMGRHPIHKVVIIGVAHDWVCRLYLDPTWEIPEVQGRAATMRLAICQALLACPVKP